MRLGTGAVPPPPQPPGCIAPPKVTNGIYTCTKSENRGIKITVLKAIKTIYIQKIAQVAAACNPESNAASLPNQRVRSSLNYR